MDKIYMKILLTHEVFPPESMSGGEKLTLKLIELLKKRGNEVKVLTSGNPNIKEFNGIETIRVPTNRYLMNFSLPTILKEAKDVDLIQTSSGNMCFSSWLAAKTLKKPICCHIHHIFGPYWKEVRGPILGRFFECMEKLYLKRSYDAVIFQNFNSKDIGTRMGIKENKIHMIQPGIEWEKYQMKIRKEPFVLFVGNLNMDKPATKVKGLDYLIEATKMLPDVNFLIVGGGSEINKLKMHYQKNIIFTGPLIGKTLMELYNRSLIFCCLSLTEGFGLSLLEAMTSGCATISTIDIGQKGPIIEPKNAKQIIDSIRYFIDNPNDAKKIGTENKKIARKNTWEKFIQDYLKVYEDIL